MKFLRTKKGIWGRFGSKGKDPLFPGSYGDYVYIRAAPKEYPKTAQQAKVGKAGRMVGEKCKGKKGAEFKKCRHEVMKEVFGLSE